MPEKRPKKAQVNRKRSTRRQPTDRSTLSAIARGMQHAVNSTQEIMEGHYLRIFNKYFYKDGRPKSVDFNISPEQIVRAPLIALVPLNSLLLDEVVVEMSIKVIDTTSKKLGAKDQDTELDRTSFDVSFASGDKSDEKTTDGGKRKDNAIGIVMKFKRGDPPEGVSRVLDEFYKAVVVSRAEKEKKQSK